MTGLIRTSACLIAAALLTACTTLAPEQVAQDCAGTDWERFGLNDGKLGVSTEERVGKFGDCAEVGQPADLAAYQLGRSEGLLSYCTTESGYRVGYDGLRYRSVCPPTLEPDFLQGFEKGRKDRPAVALYPRIGIGIGSGGGRVRTGIGIGIGIGSYHDCDRHWRYRHRCW